MGSGGTSASLVRIIGTFVAAVGLAGVVYPDSLRALAQSTTTPFGLVLVAIVRIAIGTVLIAAAKATRWPVLVRILGAVSLVGGIATFFLGSERAQAIAAWWSGQGPVLIRLLPALGFVFGLVLVQSTLPGRRPAS